MAADSRVRRGLRLTPQQELDERLMWAVLERVRDLRTVLKGGTALAFTYDLNRQCELPSFGVTLAAEEITAAAAQPVVFVDNSIWLLCARDEAYLTDSELDKIASNSRQSRTGIEPGMTAALHFQQGGPARRNPREPTPA